MNLRISLLTATLASTGILLSPNSASAFTLDIQGNFTLFEFSGPTVSNTYTFDDSLKEDFLNSVSDNDSSLTLAPLLPSFHDLLSQLPNQLSFPTSVSLENLVDFSGTGAVDITNQGVVSFGFVFVEEDSTLEVPVAEVTFEGEENVADCVEVSCIWSGSFSELKLSFEEGQVINVVPPGSLTFTITSTPTPQGPTVTSNLQEATPVPETTSVLGLLALGTLGATTLKGQQKEK